MRQAVVLCGSILPWHIFFCSVCSLPLPENRTVSGSQQPQQRPHSNSHVGLKKRGRHEQDTPTPGLPFKPVLASRNDTDRRCGVPDYPTSTQVGLVRYKLTGKDRQQRRRRFALFGWRWEKTHLTYKILRFPWQLSESKVRSVLQEALGVWSAVTPLTFREVTGQNADIVIDFSRFWHGDSLPFDGPGGILAHALFPRTRREGEVHFDYDEDWTVSNNVGTDLLQVAAHEFGHVLGLQHSLEPDAVMCPFYSDFYPLQLSEDDKRGIQHLYGPPLHASPESNEIDSEMLDACKTNFDAVSMIRGELFFFKSRYVWRIRDGNLQAGYPALTSRHWEGISDQLDAVYEDRSGNIWFFHGGSYWVFDAERKIKGPEPVQQLGLPVTHIQAALKWEEHSMEKIYLFKATSYWAFDPQQNKIDDVRPRSVRGWGGLPRQIDAAFRDTHGYANFLSGLQYWKFDPVMLQLLEGYPRSIGQDFFGCSIV